MYRRLLQCALCGSIFALIATKPIQAADVTWTNAGGGNWGAGANWSTAAVPGALDTAIFNLGATYTTTFAAAPNAIQALIFNAPSGILTLQSSGGVRTLGISAPGGSNRLFALGTSTVNLGGISAGTGVNLYIVNGMFVANSANFVARQASNINLIGGLDVGTVIDGNLAVGTATYTITGAATNQVGGNLAIASSGVAGVNGVLNIHGSNSALTQYNNVDVANVTVGSVFGGTGAINIGTITTGGAMTTGTGQLTINRTGTVTIGDSDSTGTLNANGNILIDGGVMNTTGTFNWVPGRTMSIINGGDAIFNVDITTASNAVVNVSGFGSSYTTLGLGIDIGIGGGATINVGSQGLLSSAGVLTVGTVAAGGNGFLVADGVGARVEALSATASQIAASGNIGDVTFSNQAVGSFVGGLNIGASATAGTTGFLTVESGADLTGLGSVNLATAGGATTAATMTITGPGSSVTLAASKVLTIGHASAGSAVVNVNDGGSLVVGAAGSTVLNSTGTINIDGGIVSLQDFAPGGGKINFYSGSLTYLGGLTIGTGGLLGTNLTLTSQHSLTNSLTTVNSGSLLSIESGAGFSTGTLTNNGQVILSGLDAVANATTINNAGLLRGEGRLVVGTFNNNANGELRAEEGKLILVQGANGTNAGRVNLLGGTAQFSNPLTNGTTGTITGRGKLIIGGVGLTNNGNLSLSSGISDVFGDVNNATGVATRGVTVSGNSDVTFWDDVTNGAGSLFVVRTGSSATFFGTFAGGGIGGGGSTYFEADISPGFSPAAVTFATDVTLGTNAKLNIELGGTTAGTQYDQITVTQLLTLGGTLNITLINGFVPQFGQTFDILNWTTLSGTFANVVLPSLTSGWTWATTQLYTTGIIGVMSSQPGDFDGDGDVDGADFVAWQTNFPKASGATPGQGDADGDGDVDGADFVVWQTNFPFTPGPGASPVPEPATWLLALGAILPFYFRSRRTGQRNKIAE
jgi:hypothetical protein